MSRAFDPRTPVLVGGGQLNQRSGSKEPVDMMVDAVRMAAQDAGAPSLADAVQSVRVVNLLSWRYRNPGALVGERLGAPVRHTVYTGAGGSHPQALLNDAAEDIAAGRVDVVVVCGAEAWRTRMALKKAGERPDWTRQGEDVAEPETRPEVPMRHETEVRAGLDRPAHVYPLFEQALRVSAGRSVKEHRTAIAELWSRFSEVAADNPFAWSREVRTPAEIEHATPENRMVCWPYTKLMNSNNNVEQAAAVIICSAEAAERHRVPRDQWVFLLAGAEGSDPAAIAERLRLDGSAAIRHAGRTALQLAGVRLDDIHPVDLYSCFPSAVQVAAAELGLPVDDPRRPLTVTGGLTFAGGPWNNYSTHAIATMLGEVRRTQAPGLLTANSGYLTKHAVGVYGAKPGEGFRRASVQKQVDAEPVRDIAVEYAGPAELEAWCVLFDRDGEPQTGMAAVLLPDGARALVSSADEEVVARLVTEEAQGSRVDVRGDGAFVLR